MMVLFLGLVAGMAHVLVGPDHLAAIAPLATDNPQRATWSGFSWGVGHATGVMIVGLVAMLVRESLPTAWLSSVGERLVGVVLILIGFWGFYRARREHVHVHSHEHDGSLHSHLHVHGHRHAEEAVVTHRHTHAALGIGILHGVAGGSHLLGIVPALAFATRVESALYLAGFGAGTIAAMAGFATVLGQMSTRFAGRRLLFPALRYGLASLAIVVGAVWLVA
jgi:sulfite exporter TauE/SafE